MDKYYYFVAQLPMLFFGKETSITIDYFLEEAQKWLSAKDYNVLLQVDVKNISIEKKDYQVLREYKNFELHLQTDIAMWRQAKQLDQDFKPTIFPVSYIKEGNPLEVEIKFMEMRWAFIDEMERNFHFDMGIIILYYLKLQLLRRFFTFNKEKGLTKFQKFYEVNV